MYLLNGIDLRKREDLGAKSSIDRKINTLVQKLYRIFFHVVYFVMHKLSMLCEKFVSIWYFCYFVVWGEMCGCA